MKSRMLGVFLPVLVALGGCASSERAVPVSAAPTTVVVTPPAGQRVVMYPEGRYQLYGDGTARSPFYWVWIPAGASPPSPPPPPGHPQTQ
jgi:hypothetical protein